MSTSWPSCIKIKGDDKDARKESKSTDGTGKEKSGDGQTCEASAGYRVIKKDEADPVHVRGRYKHGQEAGD